jgi:hypothetical protein
MLKKARVEELKVGRDWAKRKAYSVEQTEDF